MTESLAGDVFSFISKCSLVLLIFVVVLALLLYKFQNSILYLPRKVNEERDY